MKLYDSFQTPANWDDFPNDPKASEQFHASWSQNVEIWTQQAIIGNPWSTTNNANCFHYFNPLEDVPISGSPVALPINWTAFPGRFTYLFSDENNPGNPLTSEQQLELADTGSATIQGIPQPITQLKVPNQLCPGLAWQGGKSFTPTGPRGWQDEYCEWAVTRNQANQIIRIAFTCENPEYWLTLWRQDPGRVVEIYEQLVGHPVLESDLYLRDQNGNPVKDPLTNYYVYDPTNRWNRGPVATAAGGGAIHLSSPPNTLGAEITLAAATTLLRSEQASQNPQTLICCSQYGRPFRNSDPHIGFTANRAILGFQGKQISAVATLENPVGLYIQRPTPEQWLFFKTPDGTDASEFWTTVRGHEGTNGEPDYILHAVYEVPPEKDYTISDITINGKLIQWAGQIAQNMKVQLNAVAYVADKAKIPLQERLPCVADKTGNAAQPAPAQPLFASEAIFDAVYQLFNTVNLAPQAKQGTTLQDMVLVVQGGQANATIEFSEGVSATVTQFIANIAGGPPGQTSSSGLQAYVVDVEIAADAPLGAVGVRVINPDGPTGLPYYPGALEVVA